MKINNAKLGVTLMIIASFCVPSLVFAITNNKLSDIIDIITGYLSDILFLLMGIAVLIFVWFVIKYYIMPNEDRKNANLYVMYALIGFFVILSLWGIVGIIGNTFGLSNPSGPSTWQNFSNLFPR